ASEARPRFFWTFNDATLVFTVKAMMNSSLVWYYVASGPCKRRVCLENLRNSYRRDGRLLECFF
ncbi:MAG: hypothetical protein ABN489_24690, partial [Pseudomonas amygdali]